MVVLKAMGMESIQEVVQMVGRDPRYGALLLPSIEVANSAKMLLFLEVSVIPYYYILTND